jgi:hypothetical protein
MPEKSANRVVQAVAEDMLHHASGSFNGNFVFRFDDRRKQRLAQAVATNDQLGEPESFGREHQTILFQSDEPPLSKPGDRRVELGDFAGFAQVAQSVAAALPERPQLFGDLFEVLVGEISIVVHDSFPLKRFQSRETPLATLETRGN